MRRAALLAIVWVILGLIRAVAFGTAVAFVGLVALEAEWAALPWVTVAASAFSILIIAHAWWQRRREHGWGGQFKRWAAPNELEVHVAVVRRARLPIRSASAGRNIWITVDEQFAREVEAERVAGEYRVEPYARQVYVIAHEILHHHSLAERIVRGVEGISERLRKQAPRWPRSGEREDSVLHGLRYLLEDSEESALKWLLTGAYELALALLLPLVMVVMRWMSLFVTLVQPWRIGARFVERSLVAQELEHDRLAAREAWAELRDNATADDLVHDLNRLLSVSRGGSTTQSDTHPDILTRMGVIRGVVGVGEVKPKWRWRRGATATKDETRDGIEDSDLFEDDYVFRAPIAVRAGTGMGRPHCAACAGPPGDDYRWWFDGVTLCRRHAFRRGVSRDAARRLVDATEPLAVMLLIFRILAIIALISVDILMTLTSLAGGWVGSIGVKSIATPRQEDRSLGASVFLFTLMAVVLIAATMTVAWLQSREDLEEREAFVASELQRYHERKLRFVLAQGRTQEYARRFLAPTAPVPQEPLPPWLPETADPDPKQDAKEAGRYAGALVVVVVLPSLLGVLLTMTSLHLSQRRHAPRRRR